MLSFHYCFISFLIPFCADDPLERTILVIRAPEGSMVAVPESFEDDTREECHQMFVRSQSDPVKTFLVSDVVDSISTPVK